jgi:Transmembrane domain of unknown function (DUF3566)
MWLTDGSTEGALAAPESAPADQQPALSDSADGANSLPDLPMPSGSYVPPDKDMPYSGSGTSYAADGPEMPFTPASQETAANGDGLRIPPYQPQVPPLPAHQVTPPPVPAPEAPSPGMAAKVAAPFAALTKPKPKLKSKKPARLAKPSRFKAVVQPASTAQAATAVTRPVPAPVPRSTPATAPTRRAQLVLARIEPWSVMKFSFMISLVGWVILFVAVAALYYVLSKLGVFHSVQSTITDVTSGKGSSGSDANGQWFSASRILGYTMLAGAVNVVLITALATVGAVIYNLVTHLAGGIEVTLKETD